MASNKVSSFNKLLAILKFQRKEIYSIYVYAIFSGLVALSLPLGIQSIISFVMGGAISTSLVLLIAFVITGVFISGLLKVNQMKITERIQQQLFTSYSFRYSTTIPRLSIFNIDKYYLPEVTNRFFDVISVQKSISKLLLEIPAASIQIIFGLILLSFYHPFFIFFGILLLVVLFAIIRYTGNRGLKTSILVSDFKYKTANYMQEMSRIILNLKFIKNRQWTLKKTDEYIDGYLKARTSHFSVLIVQYWTLITFKVIIVSTMLIVGSYLLVNQQLNIGQFIATEIVIISIVDSIEKLILNLDKVYDTLTSVEKINKLLDMEKDKSGNLQSQFTSGPSIKISDLSFTYPDGKKVLNNINATIGKGDKVCIMGVNGSGKSTLLKIISGIYETQQGDIYINNTPIGNYNIDSYRQSIGLMFGTHDILEASIRDNICLGATGISDEKLYELSELTGLRAFVDECPAGFEYRLAPLGLQLPERTVRKILLMRALVHNSPLLLLEEPWLGIESHYAGKIQDYLLNSLIDTTVIVITSDIAFASKCAKTIKLVSGNSIIV